MSDPFQPKKTLEVGEQAENEAVTEGQEVTIREEKGGALLTVELPPLQTTLEFQGKKFVIKPEFHVTVVGFAAKLDKKTKEASAARREPISNSVASEKVKAALQKAAEGKKFKVKFSPETRLATKGESQTIIKMCEVEGTSEYLREVENDLGLPEGSIELPPTHITVYTLENGQGIGISNQAQLEELTVPLQESEVAELNQAARIKE